MCSLPWHPVQRGACHTTYLQDSFSLYGNSHGTKKSHGLFPHLSNAGLQLHMVEPQCAKTTLAHLLSPLITKSSICIQKTAWPTRYSSDMLLSAGTRPIRSPRSPDAALLAAGTFGGRNFSADDVHAPFCIRTCVYDGKAR